MFCGTLQRWSMDKTFFPEAYSRAFAFLQGRDALNLKPGKYPVDGEKIFALAQDVTTEDDNARRFEAHAKYADIQLVLAGAEKQLFTTTADGLAVTEDNFAANDVAFYTRPALYNSVILLPSCYAVYLPGEPHCPNCAVGSPGETARKIVFKILF
ncbi:hypothetical protein FACS1894206_04980 [Deltaproteobacteria bacterium]|nr:hypothetical protein FACS1894206_04980 [Deltaproteobacteria bacterium]